MENKGITETSISQISGSSITSKPSRDEDTRSIKRENDSMDDFEHLEHETSPNEDSRLDEVKNVLDVTSAQLIDVPRPEKKMSVSEIVGGEKVVESGSLATSLASQLERNILDTSIPADERILQPVPATPPPSANYEQSVNVVPDEDVRRFSPETAAPPKQDEEPVVKVHHEDECRATLESLPEPRMDAKAASLAFMEMERGDEFSQPPSNVPVKVSSGDVSSLERATMDDVTSVEEIGQPSNERIEEHKWAIDSGIEDTSVMTKSEDSPESQKSHDFISNIASSVLPVPEKSPEYDFLAGETSPNLESKKLPNETKNIIDDDTWNVVERPEAKILGFANGEIESSRRDRHVDDEAPTKPLPPLPKNEIEEEEDDDQSHARNNYPTKEQHTHDDIYEMSNDYVSQTIGKTSGQQQQSGAETGDSEFESAPEQSPAKTSGKTSNETIGSSYRGRKADQNDDIAPKEIFTDMGLDAWFNPERLNPKVAALIYWRQPEKTGIVFGSILGVLLSLAYFSLISVFAYLSLLTLCGTVGFRVYKTFVQAVQKTSDGHPFKDILEVDLTLPAEKVHEVADVAVAHANATVAELRRLFLVEDFIDSFKFGVGLWCLTYLGSWFNGMTLIIIGVVALFTLPKVYETNMAQIDQNVALVRGKINELTAKVKAAIPLGKKSEPTKEE